MDKPTLQSRVNELMFDGKKRKEIFEIVQAEGYKTTLSTLGFCMSKSPVRAKQKAEGTFKKGKAKIKDYTDNFTHAV